MPLMLQNTLYSWKVVLSFHMLLIEDLLNIHNPDVFVSNARPHSSVCCLFILLWMLLNRCDSAACHLDSSREAQNRTLDVAAEINATYLHQDMLVCPRLFLSAEISDI